MASSVAKRNHQKKAERANRVPSRIERARGGIVPESSVDRRSMQN
jgi:hypothetical protein